MLKGKLFLPEIRELEIALLTIIALLNQQIENKSSHLNYHKTVRYNIIAIVEG